MTRAIFLLFAHIKHLSTMISMKQTTSIFVTPVTVINRIKIPRKNTTANVSSKNDVEKETAEEEETSKIGSEEEAEATIEEKKIPERASYGKVSAADFEKFKAQMVQKKEQMHKEAKYPGSKKFFGLF